MKRLFVLMVLSASIWFLGCGCGGERLMPPGDDMVEVLTTCITEEDVAKAAAYSGVVRKKVYPTKKKPFFQRIDFMGSDSQHAILKIIVKKVDDVDADWDRKHSSFREIKAKTPTSELGDAAQVFFGAGRNYVIFWDRNRKIRVELDALATKYINIDIDPVPMENVEQLAIQLRRGLLLKAN